MSVCKTCGKAMLTEWAHDHRKDRPDVAALAAALDAVERPPYVPTRHIRGVLVAHRYEAAKVIAALAAEGWRITSVPEDSDEASSPASGEAKSEVVTADDPVSAQAAPDPEAVLDTLPIVRARVRAALEGLRAEIDSRVRPDEWPNGLADRINAAIDARLAALK